MMAPPSRTSPLQGIKVSITVAFIFFLIAVLTPKSVCDRAGGSVLSESKRVIGSKPPACENKCMKCRPCMATVVVPNHQRKGFKVWSRGEDDRYYLVSWKCRCGEKLFQP